MFMHLPQTTASAGCCLRALPTQFVLNFMPLSIFGNAKSTCARGVVVDEVQISPKVLSHLRMTRVLRKIKLVLHPAGPTPSTDGSIRRAICMETAEAFTYPADCLSKAVLRM